MFIYGHRTAGPISCSNPIQPVFQRTLVIISSGWKSASVPHVWLETLVSN